VNRSGLVEVLSEEADQMKVEEYNLLLGEIKKLKALGDVLRCNTSKLPDDTIEIIGRVIFDISGHLMEKLDEMHTTNEKA
jgi:hypothetical protein